MRFFGRARLGVALLALMVVASACALWPGDRDAELAGARTLELGDRHRDSVDCAPSSSVFSSGDCADWFLARIPRAGTIQIDVAQLDPAPSPPEFELVLTDAYGQVLKQRSSRGKHRLRLSRAVRAGEIGLTVRVPEAARDREAELEYELRLSFRQTTARKSGRVTSQVLELERGGDGRDAVLIDKGSKNGIARGLHGRLLEQGREIGKIEILDVYDEGSRALIRGGLSEPITPETVAEVEVP